MWTKIQTLINNTNYAITFVSISINIFLGIIWFKKKIIYFFHTKYLKKLLGFKNEEIVITQSVFEPSMISGTTHSMITYECAVCLVNITAILRTCNYKYRVYEEPSSQFDEFNIGGPTCNKKVNIYMTSLFPNFKFVTPANEKQKFDQYPINQQFIEYSQDETGFKIYKKESKEVLYYYKIDSRYNDIIFIIKLTSQDFSDNFNRTVFILFAGFNKGSLYASYFLQRHYKEIYKKVKKDHFFIAIHFNNIDNSFDQFAGIINLTDDMFK